MHEQLDNFGKTMALTGTHEYVVPFFKLQRRSLHLPSAAGGDKGSKASRIDERDKDCGHGLLLLPFTAIQGRYCVVYVVIVQLLLSSGKDAAGRIFG